MSDELNKATALVSIRNWQAINLRTPADADCKMATNVAAGLDIELGDSGPAEASLRPVTWAEKITLPVRSEDNTAHTVRGGIRVSHEAGLKLPAIPRAPKDLPLTALLRNAHGVAEWRPFVPE